MSAALIAYIPVFHNGYLKFLQKYDGKVEKLFLLGSDVLEQFSWMRKDIRAVSAAEMKHVIEVFGFSFSVEVIDSVILRKISQEFSEFIFPDEDIFHELHQTYFTDKNVTFDTVFLRWDKKKMLDEVKIEAHEHVTADEFDQKMMKRAQEVSTHSADWWRRVGAVLVKDGEVVLEKRNRHVPDEQQPYYDGDPRGNAHAGEHIDITTAFHAEAQVIAEAAKEGLALEGTSLYVTTFPCPPCAKLVAYSGIKELYFAEGYAMLDGQKILEDQGVKIIKVVTE